MGRQNGSGNETKGSTRMGEGEIVLTEEDLTDQDNVLKHEDSHDANSTWEWTFRQCGAVAIKPPKVDCEKKEITLDVSKDSNHTCNQTAADDRKDDQKIKRISKL